MLLQEVWSPDSTHVARSWQLAGGGAAGYVNGYVDVQPREEPFQPFTKAAPFINGGQAVTLVWRANDHLHIKYLASDYAGRRCPGIRRVRLTYESLAEPDSSWPDWAKLVFADRQRQEADRARRGKPPILSLSDPPDTTCVWARSGTAPAR
jgi:hypothetical protein